jgi:hypothetical protein
MKAQKTVAEWFEEIDDGLEYRRIFAREDSWKKLELDYLNDPTGDTAIGSNLVYEMGDALMSDLLVPDPEFVVEPTKSMSAKKAPIVESLDNMLVSQLRLKQHVDAATMSGYLYNRMILKLGYDSEFGWSPYYDIGKGNTLVGMTFTQFDKKGRRIESADFKPGWPWARPVLPHDFVVPWGTVLLEDAPWAAHRIVRRNDQIKADPKYKNASKLQPRITMQEYMESYLSAGTQVKDLHRKGTSSKYNMEARFNELWEIRDRETGRIYVISRDHDEYIRNELDAIQIACGMPFVSATLSPHPRAFWGTPPAYYLGQIQKTQFDIAKQAEKQRRIAVLKFLVRKGAISKEALNRLLSSDVGAYEYIDSNFPSNEVIAPVNTGNSYDFLAYENMNRDNARSAIGMSRNQSGEYDRSTRRTAREATIVAMGSGKRMGRRQSAISQFYIDAIIKVNGIVFEYWRVPREIMSDSRWESVIGPQLKGDYNYNVTLSTKRNISKAERKMEAISMVMQFSKMVPPQLLSRLFTYMLNASSDPAFESVLLPLLGSQGGGGQQQPEASAPQGQQGPSGLPGAI